jgi:hypothetical protein
VQLDSGQEDSTELVRVGVRVGVRVRVTKIQQSYRGVKILVRVRVRVRLRVGVGVRVY